MLNTTTGTTDNLTFSVSDIDVSKDNPNVLDNHNRTEELENADIVINASQDNFGQDDKTIGDGVNGKATLLANSTNSTATMNYNVYFAISENNFTYTTKEEKKPEVILKVYNPNNEEVTKITGLNYHEKDSSNPKDISGFDITGRKGVFAIESGHTIEVKDGDNGKKEENWKVEVYLINLTTDQVGNTKKKLEGQVKITTTEEQTYTLAHIESILDYTTTKNSISGTLNYTQGTNEIIEYWYKLENLGKNEAEAIALTDGYTLSETKEKFNFTGLEENTKYKIYSYVVDSEGIRSEIYESNIEIVTDKVPIIKKAEVTEVKSNKIRVEVKEVEEGSNGIDHYSYHISGNGKDESHNSNEKYYEFTDLEENIEYSIDITAYDKKEQASPVYDFDNQKTTTDLLPKINSIIATKQEATSLLFTINVTKGTNEIAKYNCTLKQNDIVKETKEGTIVDETTGTCEFNDLTPETEYSIEVEVTDSEENPIVKSSGTGTTTTLPLELTGVDVAKPQYYTLVLTPQVTGGKAPYTYHLNVTLTDSCGDITGTFNETDNRVQISAGKITLNNIDYCADLTITVTVEDVNNQRKEYKLNDKTTGTGNCNQCNSSSVKP